MRISTMNEIYRSRDVVDTFGGYNHNLRIGENEFYDMKNLTSDDYPVLSPRGGRSSIFDGHDIYGIAARDDLAVVLKNTEAGDDLCYSHLTITSGGASGTTVQNFVLSSTPKQLIAMGAYLIILPDKKYVNLMDLNDKGDIEATETIPAGTHIEFGMCFEDGTKFGDRPNTNFTYGPIKPASPRNGDVWVDTSTSPSTPMMYAASYSMWTPIANLYVKIKAMATASYTPQFKNKFKVGDGVYLTGMGNDATTAQAVLELNNRYSIIKAVGDNFIVVPLMTSFDGGGLVITQSRNAVIKRRMPDMDFVFESGNRLWGCKYGEVDLDMDGNSETFVNEIYCSKLGDFKNWNSFAGISTDSYTASCGTEGCFTGGIDYFGQPIFFKEHCIHKVYGNYPSNYQIQATTCNGVVKGAGNSLCIVGDKLLYKSVDGVCIYDGSHPQNIGDAFGNERFNGRRTSPEYNAGDRFRNGATAGAYNGKYYISMKSEITGEWSLFVYDVNKNMWHREDNLKVENFCTYNRKLYFLVCSDDGNSYVGLINTASSVDPNMKWMAESGDMGLSYADNKYISTVNIRMSLAVGTRVNIYILYDSCGEWEYACTLMGTTLHSFTIPIRPKRCDHFRIKIEGVGDAKIYSINKTLEQGSDAQ